MKLRNKKTGEIIEIYKGEITLHYNQGRKTIHFKHLEDLEEWEDYEEPKGYYYVTTSGLIKYDDTPFCAIHKDRKEIGNYFETREEAEKAVEKLKAWKRLKDNGFRFEGIKQDYTRFFSQQKPMRIGRKYLHFNKAEDEEWLKENWEDLAMLFGGEE